MLTHANLWWHNIGIVLALDIAYDDVTLVCAPVFHIGALNVTTIATWIKGGRLVVHEAFEAQAVLDDMERERVTTMFGVAVMCEALSTLPGFEDADLSALRLIITGGAPVPIGLIRRFQQAGVDVEIEVRGPSVTPGYFRDPDATALAHGGGWLRTGDGGHLDDEGFVFIADRIKDMIISGGENVYPAEVEGALFDHPAVAEVAVIGTPDPRWGERVCAVVVPHPGADVDLEDLRLFAGERIGRYKLPLQLEIVEALPRNATGKVLKTALRQGFQ